MLSYRIERVMSKLSLIELNTRLAYDTRLKSCPIRTCCGREGGLSEIWAHILFYIKTEIYSWYIQKSMLAHS